MSAYVLLNLLNEFGLRDKMQGLPRILSFFCNNFNKSAQMLDSNLSYGTTILKSHILFKKKMFKFSHYVCTFVMEVIT